MSQPWQTHSAIPRRPYQYGASQNEGLLLGLKDSNTGIGKWVVGLLTE